MPSTRITKTELLARYNALKELFSLTIPDTQQREKLLQNLCPERSGSLRQKALRYVYAARYAAKSSSRNDPLVKALEDRVTGANGAT